MRLIFTTLLLAIVGATGFAQVVFTEFPKDNALYPRDLMNTGTVWISGTAVAPEADSLVLQSICTDGQTLRYAAGMNTLPGNGFSAAFYPEAKLENYTYQAYLKNADSTWLIASAINVVAGDVYVINGQSNAQAVAYNGDANIWQNNYVRCFGSSNPDDFANTQWYIAEGNGYFTPGAVGQWPLRMGSLIADVIKVPVAIINGADPGKPIEFFQCNDAQRDDPATNYGRLRQRLANAGLTDHIRAILYYQGESDGNRADIHKSLFEALYADWAADFPGVEAWYGVQVREGCGAPSLQLREYQKNFENYLPGFKSMTVNAITGHDGCHYSVAGYEQIGTKMAKQLARDLYGWQTPEQLNVRVVKAEYSNENNTEITLTTDAAGLIAQPGSGVDFKLPGISSSVKSISAAGASIILELDQPVYNNDARIAYGGHAGDGPWVFNEAGNGLFSFYDLPIGNHTSLPNFDLPGIMSGPGNCLSLDGQDDCLYLGAVLGSSYTKEAWINWQGGGNGNNILSGAANTAFWAPSLGNGYYLAAGHNGAWGYVIDPLPIQPGEWIHAAVTYDAATAEMRLYRNGNLVSAAQNVPPHSDPELYAGAYAGAYTFQGKLDEIRVWDHARSIEDIRAAMCHKLTGDEPGLSSYFRFDETAGALAPNVTDKPDGQLLNFQTPGWQRSAAPIGTKSTYSYENIQHLALSLASGDSLVLTAAGVPEFVQLYFTEEVPNVLQPAANYALVDNTRYFGLFYPNQSIDTFNLTYHYSGNPLANVDEPRLSLLHRASNAQPFWEAVDGVQLDVNENHINAGGNVYQEYILAIRENTIATNETIRETCQVYPNPTTGIVYIKDLEVETAVLYDALGRVCLTHSGEKAATLNLQTLPAGLYWLKVRGKNGKIYRQTIIRK